jgi:hypothetical protein
VSQEFFSLEFTLFLSASLFSIVFHIFSSWHLQQDFEERRTRILQQDFDRRYNLVATIYYVPCVIMWYVETNDFNLVYNIDG